MKVGEVVEVKEKSRQMNLVLEAQALAERDVPDYIEVDTSKFTAKLLAYSGAHRCALRGADGAAPGRGILLALIRESVLVRRRNLAPADGLRRIQKFKTLLHRAQCHIPRAYKVIPD